MADVGITDNSCFWGIGRGRTRRKAVIKPLAQIFAARVCGKHIKDVKLFLVGAQGSGKSRSFLFLAVRCAEEIAKKRGGVWQDYFPEDLSNVIIGDPAGHADMLKSMKKYNIYIMDDAGVSVNARNFASSYNKSLNDIFQTIRTDRCILLLSAPDTFLIDKVPRTLFNFYGEVAESMHSLGVNLIKIFRLERRFRENDTREIYLQFGNTQVVRHRFLNPPQTMIDRYEILRDKATQVIKSNAGGKERNRKEKEPPQYVTCPYCNYTWAKKTTKAPKRCPECFKRLPASPAVVAG